MDRYTLRAGSLVVLLLGLAGCVTPRATVAANPADLWLGTDRQARFESWVRDLEDGALISHQGLARLGTTWEEGVARARGRVLAARTEADVWAALLSLKNALHDGHAELQVPAALRPPPRQWRLPVSLRWALVDGVAALEVAPGSPGLEPGLRLLRVDGRPVEQVFRDYLEWHRDSSPERAQQAFARWLTVRESFRSPAPTAPRVTLTLQEPGVSEPRTYEVAFTSGPPAPEPLPTDADYAGRTPVFRGLNVDVYEDQPTRTLVVRSLSFSYQFDTAELWNRVAVLSWPVQPLEAGRGSAGGRLLELDMQHLGDFLRSRQKDVARVLVDVRDNPGGGVNLPLQRLLASRPFRTTTRAVAARPLFARDAEFRDAALRMAASPAMVKRMEQDLATGAAQTSAFAFDCRSEACPDSEALVEPDARHLEVPVVVLSGPACISSCDQFVAVVADNALARVVGLPSTGASAPFRAPRRFTLANGQTFSLTLNVGLTWRPNGEVLEGNPARPGLVFPVGRGSLREVLDALATER